MYSLKRTLFKAAGLAKLPAAGIWITILLSSLLLLSGCKKELKTSTLEAESDAKQRPLKNLKPVDLKLIAANFVSPVGLVAAPDATGRLFVIDQIGKIWVINAAGSTLTTPFLDVSSKMVSLMPAYDERGLLGLAFHPDY